MRYKAVFVDFYGTLVHEDDEIVTGICETVRLQADRTCDADEIGRHWYRDFLAVCKNSSGTAFQPQRAIGLASLDRAIRAFGAACDAGTLIRSQFDYWQRPSLYPDTKPFLEGLGVPVYIVSNIDRQDLADAVRHHGLRVTGLLTSEDVRAYKPHPALFEEALRVSGLTPADVVHIGDSLVNDVSGAQRLGIDAVWLNRSGKPPRPDIVPDAVCRGLDEVRAVLNGA